MSDGAALLPPSIECTESAKYWEKSQPATSDAALADVETPSESAAAATARVSFFMVPSSLV